MLRSVVLAWSMDTLGLVAARAFDGALAAAVALGFTAAMAPPTADSAEVPAHPLTGLLPPLARPVAAEMGTDAAAVAQVWHSRAPEAVERGALPIALPQVVQTTHSGWKAPKAHLMVPPVITAPQATHFSPNLVRKHPMQ
mmetsp:Transcript_137947/g.384749  ORF Transcript_137947/g.384749 Transcript_137947/m.384749 type:complete len:140 (-) Transcript_137947:434-853(-)